MSLSIFQYAGADIGTVLVDGEPWFVAADVCDFFGVTNRNRTLQALDADTKGGTRIDTPGGAQTVTIINEPGLYSLLFMLRPTQARGVTPEYIEERLEKVRSFQRWVTHEVLPQIRRTGSFHQTQIEHQPPQSYADALRELATSVERQLELEAKALEDAPKVEAYDALMDADGFYSMDAVAKIIGGIGRNNLYKRLRDLGVIQNGSTQPYQRYAHHFKLVASVWRSPDGVEHPTFTTKVLPSGLDFIRKQLSKVVV